MNADDNITNLKILDKDNDDFGLYAFPVPWVVKLGVTYGCKRQCDFCGVRDLTKNCKWHPEYMTVETARLIAQQLNEWVPDRRIEINGYGEPLENPHLIEIIQTIHQEYPSGYITLMTGGANDILDPEKFNEFTSAYFEAGGNVLIINGQGGTRLQYLNNSRKFSKQSEVPVLDRVDGESSEPMFIRRSTDFKKIYVLDDTGFRALLGNKTVICNHGGHAQSDVHKKYKMTDTDKLPMKKSCLKPFRELFIGAQGEVLICDFDYKRELILGNINDTNMRAIWNSKEFNFLRYRIRDRNRSKISPCMYCSYCGGNTKWISTLPKIRVVPDREDKNRLVDIQYTYSDLIHPDGKSRICNRVCKSTYESNNRNKDKE